eukprot:gene15375-6609_t
MSLNGSYVEHTIGTPKPNETMSSESGLSHVEVVLITMYIPFLLVAAFGNLLVILVRVRKFKSHGLSAYKQLICHLSVADIVCAMAIPLDIYLKINKKDWLQHSHTCKFIQTSLSASLTASICILTAMAFERYQGISNPLAHHWSTKKVTVLAIVIWIYSYANFIPYARALDVEEERCSDNHYPSPQFVKWYTLFQFFSNWLVPLIFIIVFHFGMVIKVISHRRTIKRSTYHTPSTQNQCNKQPSRANQKKRKMVKILVVIVTLFALLTLPNHIWYLWYEFSDRSEKQNYNLAILEIFAAFVYLHTAVNPVIYSIMDRSFRDDVKMLFNYKPTQPEAVRMRAINGATQESF